MVDRKSSYDLWPRQLDKAAKFSFEGTLDFGSFRDLQRHRRDMVQMPMVTSTYGLNSWYLKWFEETDSHSGSTLSQTIDDICEQTLIIEDERTFSRSELQYVQPMMTNVPIKLDWSLGQVVYGTELRSKTTVHPTLRSFVLEVGHSALRLLPKLNLFLDERDDYAQSERGQQDIVEKVPAETEVDIEPNCETDL